MRVYIQYKNSIKNIYTATLETHGTQISFDKKIFLNNDHSIGCIFLVFQNISSNLMFYTGTNVLANISKTPVTVGRLSTTCDICTQRYRCPPNQPDFIRVRQCAHCPRRACVMCAGSYPGFHEIGFFRPEMCGVCFYESFTRKSCNSKTAFFDNTS